MIFFFPAGHRDAAGGRELPASVSQRDAAGQQRGVHEGEGQRSTDCAEVNEGQWTSREY